jgi:hypothetical protein
MSSGERPALVERLPSTIVDQRVVDQSPGVR